MKILLTLILLFGCITLYPQTTFYSEDFEGATTDWSYSAPSGNNNNFWVWGSGVAGAIVGPATHQGTGSLQVWRYSSGWWSDYNTGKSASRYATKTFDFSSLATNAIITMNFWLLVEGESIGSSYYDYFRVLANGVEQGTKQTSSGGWIELSYDLSAYAGTSVDIDLHWVNDNSLGIQPGARIDDIEVIYTLPPEQPGDDPYNAIALEFNGPYVQYDNKLMSNTTTEVLPTCANYVNKDMWFTFVVPLDGTEAEVDTQSGTMTDSGMEWYRGSIGSLVSIECDDDDGLDGLMSWIQRNDLTPGETIYVRIWEYGGSSGPGEFSIRASGPTTLPVELSSFTGQALEDYNLIDWITESEHNSDYFILERSRDGYEWGEISNQIAAGESMAEIRYSYVDNNFFSTTYYRLLQYDIDGKYEIFGPISVEREIKDKKVVKYLNLMGQEVNPLTTTGLVIKVFEDGSMIKVIR